jgi:hypothetical protein
MDVPFEMKEENEITVKYTPDGKPFSFSEYKKNTESC